MQRLLDRWSCRDPVLVADTPTSRVWRVRRGTGTAILKELKPLGLRDRLPIAAFLAWRDGRGYVRLLEEAPTALLLEDGGTRSLRDELDADGDDDAVTRRFTDVLAEIHAPLESSPPAELRPLEDWFASLFGIVDADPRLAVLARLARTLLAHQQDRLPLHGDLHHENVVCSERGWLAIDPNGLVGDPAFEVANIFSNPLDRDDLCMERSRILARAAMLAPAVGRDPMTIVRWAAAYAGLSAAWYLEDGSSTAASRSLGVAEALLAALQAVALHPTRGSG